LGEVGIQKCTYGRLLSLSAAVQANDEETTQYEQANTLRSAGDPEIIWDFRGTLWNVSSNPAC
jgi:hypothetical protein